MSFSMRLFETGCVFATAALCLSGALAAAATDEYRDADLLQSGYLPNHNMDPNVVASTSFGQLWRVFTGGADTQTGDGGSSEEFLAKPLVYTPLKGGYGGRQVVIACSETNWVYVLDAVNGTIYNKRQLHRPFLSSDVSCNDINAQIGITGTPTIDSDTDVMYLYSKTYIGSANGYQNGVYYFHAIDVNTLTDVYPPVNTNGGPADNDPNGGIWFDGGTQLQRPSLSLINGAVYAGFGGHCDQFNYTGFLIVNDAATGVVIQRFATEVGSYAPAQDGSNNYKAGGGGSGIWQSGMGLTSDGPSRLFFVTGNDDAHQNTELAASGRGYLGTLGEAIVNVNIDPNTRKVSLQDYFEPYEYISMDGGDRDLGAGGIAGLDPTVFKGTNVAHIGVTIGKNGKGYVVNMDNLGGYKNGPNGGDLVIQTLPMPGGSPIFGGAGSYPLEGGYIYMTPVGSPTQVYQFVPDAQGNPRFVYVAQTPDTSAGRVGVGQPTITTNGGTPGTAILWVTDVDAGLRAYHAVPQADGSMKKINMPSTPSLNKYQRPAFGDGRLYLGTSDGHIICLGSPVAQPFTCSIPIDFGSVVLGSSAAVTINCTANIPITAITGLTIINPLFQASNASLPTGSLKTGQSFSFPAVFNLTTASIQNTVNTSFSGVKPGVASGAITLYTVNGVTGYSTSQPLALSSKTVSKSGFLSLSPTELDFGGLVVNSSAAQSGLSGSIVISNIGVGSLTIANATWLDLTDDDDDTPVLHPVTKLDSTQWMVGNGFNATNFPSNGYVIPGGQSISISLNFRGTDVGTYGSQLTITPTVGSAQSVILSGAMSNAPVAALTINNGEGGSWQPSIIGYTTNPDDGSTITEVGVQFGNLYPGNSSIYTMRLTNSGGSALLVTKSKPPETVELTATNPTGSLPEGGQISPNDYSDAPVIFQPSLALTPPNSDPRQVNGTWTLNTNDLNFGVHVVTFSGTVITQQRGPLNTAGNSLYKYLGCYQDSANGGPRLFPSSINNGPNNENGLCQTEAHSAGAIFAGTEYHTQCWYGNVIPNSTFLFPESADQCSWVCPADNSQPCGGDGGFISVFYDSTKYNPATGVCTGCGTATAAGDGGGVASSLAIVPSVGSYAYAGCYTETTTGRALNGATYAYNTMTPQSCAASCGSKFNMFGVEYGRECYCGNSLQAGSVLSSKGDAGCNVACAGNATEACGAGGLFSLYVLQTNGTSGLPSSSTIATSTASATATGFGNFTVTSSSVSAPTGTLAIKPVVGAYTYLGCQTEATGMRALSMKSTSSNTMTLESCASDCVAYTYFGTEYGRECYCGNSFNAGSVAAPQTDCGLTCAGTPYEYCGAGNRLSVYMLTQGNTTSATGIGRPTSSPDPTSTTVLLNTALTSVTSLPSGITNFTRSSTASSSVATSIIGLTATSSPSATSSTSPALSTPVHVAAVGAYSWIGCYSEAANMRALDSATHVNYTSMTVEQCASFCSPKYTMFGIEYGGECYCGNTLQIGSVLTSTSDCNFLCGGNKLEYCGAGNRLDVYQLGTTMSSSSSSTPSLTTTTAVSLASSSAVTTPTTFATSVSSNTLTTTTLSVVPTAASSSGSDTSPVSTSPSTTIHTTVSPVINAAFLTTSTTSSTATSSLVTPTTSSTIATSSSPAISASASILTTASIANSHNSLGSFSSVSSTSASSASSSKISSTSSTTLLPATYTGPPVISHGNSNFSYYGCIAEPASGRALQHEVESNAKAMTIEQCLGECYMYKYAGVEWSQECWCGNTLNPAATNISDSQCSMKCSGNSSEFCGNGVKLSLYVFNVTKAAMSGGS